MYEMWKEDKEGMNSGNLQWFQVDGQRIQQHFLKHAATGTKADMTRSVLWIRMEECFCGVESARVTLELRLGRELLSCCQPFVEENRNTG